MKKKLPILKKFSYKVKQKVVVRFLSQRVPCEILTSGINKADRKSYTAISLVPGYAGRNHKYVYIGEEGSELYTNIFEEDQSKLKDLIANKPQKKKPKSSPEVEVNDGCIFCGNNDTSKKTDEQRTIVKLEVNIDPMNKWKPRLNEYELTILKPGNNKMCVNRKKCQSRYTI